MIYRGKSTGVWWGNERVGNWGLEETTNREASRFLLLIKYYWSDQIKNNCMNGT